MISANLLRINNWATKKLLIIILSIQFSLWGVIALENMGIQIPILRQFLGFVYLTFIPGILIIRIFRLHALDTINALLYSVGLSISTIIIIGLLIDQTSEYFGIYKPFSISVLTITLSFTILILCLFCYFRDKDYLNLRLINDGYKINKFILFFIFIPILTVLGTHLMNYYNNNIVLLIAVFIIASIVILVSFGKFIPTIYYPFIIFILSISLLFHKSLISPNLWGTDIHLEYYWSNFTLNNGFWNSSLSSNLNSLPSIVILCPLYSIILKMDITWVFKIIYPFLFSLLPLGLYQIFVKQTNEKIAFMACFFFISVDGFYTIMLEAARQQIAQLFIMLFILVLLDKKITLYVKHLFLIIFYISLVMSHYSTVYLFMFSIFCVWLLKIIVDSNLFTKYFHKLSSKFTDISFIKLKKSNRDILTLNLVLLSTIFTVYWYLYTSNASAFEAFIHVISKIASGVFTGFMDPNEIEGLNIIVTKNVSTSHAIAKCLHVFSQVLIFAGILSTFSRFEKTKFNRDYYFFSLVFFAIIFISLVIPQTSVQIGIGRTYSIVLSLLAPYFVIGFVELWNTFNRTKNTLITIKSGGNCIKVLSIFLFIFLLFNSGFIYEVFQDNPSSIAFNNQIKTPKLVYEEGDFNGAQWLLNKEDTSFYQIYTGDYERLMLLEFVEKDRLKVFNANTTTVPKGQYIFIGSLSTVDNKILRVYFKSSGFERQYDDLNTSHLYNYVVKKRNKIFDNKVVNVFI